MRKRTCGGSNLQQRCPGLCRTSLQGWWWNLQPFSKAWGEPGLLPGDDPSGGAPICTQEQGTGTPARCNTWFRNLWFSKTRVCSISPNYLHSDRSKHDHYLCTEFSRALYLFPSKTQPMYLPSVRERWDLTSPVGLMRASEPREPCWLESVSSSL